MNEPQTKRRALNPWWVIAVVFGLGWVIFLAIFFRLPSGLIEAEQRPAADFTWKLADLDGHEVPLSRYRGKTIFLNIWATWCGPCVQEMPTIAALARQPGLKDVAFVCVSGGDPPDKVKQFLAGRDWPMTFLTAEDAPRGFVTQGIPATFIIAPDGTIAYGDVGARDWNSREAIALLKDLEKERTALP